MFYPRSDNLLPNVPKLLNDLPELANVWQKLPSVHLLVCLDGKSVTSNSCDHLSKNHSKIAHLLNVVFQYSFTLSTSDPARSHHPLRHFDNKHCGFDGTRIAGSSPGRAACGMGPCGPGGTKRPWGGSRLTFSCTLVALILYGFSPSAPLSSLLSLSVHNANISNYFTFRNFTSFWLEINNPTIFLIHHITFDWHGLFQK